MSTTWCFVGLLSGREITLSYLNLSNRSISEAVKLSLSDLGSCTLGFIISIVLGIASNEHAYEGFLKTFQ